MQKKINRTSETTRKKIQSYLIFNPQLMQHNKQYPWFEANQIHINKTSIRDVTAGATSATVVAPKFSDTLTLFQPGGGGRFYPTIAEVAP